MKSPARAVKTNAMRLLEDAGVPFQVRAYEVDPDDLAAETVASKIGLPPEQVFKTIVARGEQGGLCFAVIPGNSLLDLKALAGAMGDRRAAVVPLNEVLPLTGYMRGAVTVFGAKKAYPVWIDETAQLWDHISVSAGQRGVQLLLSPDDYVRMSGGRYSAIAKDR